MFVHGIKDDRPLVLMLKQDELGHALWDVVQKKCRSLPSSFILLHQGRKVLSTVYIQCGLKVPNFVPLQFSLFFHAMRTLQDT